ncbi:MAG: hypothetical protein CMN05_04820 [Roseibacillus sp.]|jgi:hypothetical protein|nr:hypothetical protein [Roseibacillus sp.]MBP34308.1 hypothetical protein [Roseibacillus sp.]MDP7655266.1 hypothetical protein [Roseibacillus sp.]|tara:strand:- start:7832 stop:8293 length:462 start_codon:yes stop_codon:yes gene_type:complete
MKKEDGDQLVAAILKAGENAVRELIDALKEVDNGEDWQERLLLHQLAMHCSVPAREKDRKILTELYASVALGDRPGTVRSFLLQQLRYVAGVSLAPRLAPLLKDDDRLVLDAVTAVMVSMGRGAEKILEAARKDAQGHAKVAITHALGQLSRK